MCIPDSGGQHCIYGDIYIKITVSSLSSVLVNFLVDKARTSEVDFQSEVGEYIKRGWSEVGELYRDPFDKDNLINDQLVISCRLLIRILTNQPISLYLSFDLLP